MIDELEKLLKKFILVYMFSLIGILLVHVLLYLYLQSYGLVFYTAGSLLMNVLILVYMYQLTYKQIKPFINLYLIFISFYLFVYSLVLWEKTPITFFWYLLIPYGISSLFKFRTIMIWCIYLLSLIIIKSIIVQTGLIDIYISFIQEQITDVLLVNISSTICILVLISIISYYNKEISRLEIVNSREVKESLEPGTYYSESEKELKYNNLYEQLILHFEKNKPYLNKDFNITQLAKEMNTNVSYISRTINKNTDTNFNGFLNRYRVMHVKKLIMEHKLDRHSLIYAYTSSGFKNQSTFNRAFKDIEGMTPTEFLRNTENM